MLFSLFSAFILVSWMISQLYRQDSCFMDVTYFLLWFLNALTESANFQFSGCCLLRTYAFSCWVILDMLPYLGFVCIQCMSLVFKGSVLCCPYTSLAYLFFFLLVISVLCISLLYVKISVSTPTKKRVFHI